MRHIYRCIVSPPFANSSCGAVRPTCTTLNLQWSNRTYIYSVIHCLSGFAFPARCICTAVSTCSSKESSGLLKVNLPVVGLFLHYCVRPMRVTTSAVRLSKLLQLTCVNCLINHYELIHYLIPNLFLSIKRMLLLTYLSISVEDCTKREHSILTACTYKSQFVCCTNTGKLIELNTLVIT